MISIKVNLEQLHGRLNSCLRCHGGSARQSYCQPVKHRAVDPLFFFIIGFHLFVLIYLRRAAVCQCVLTGKVLLVGWFRTAPPHPCSNPAPVELCPLHLNSDHYQKIGKSSASETNIIKFHTLVSNNNGEINQ